MAGRFAFAGGVFARRELLYRSLIPPARPFRSARPRSLMHRWLGSFLAVFAVALVSRAADAPHPIVPAFERFYTGGKVNAADGGRLLLAELNCVSCHADAAVARKQAPILDDVGTRVRVGWLKKFL